MLSHLRKRVTLKLSQAQVVMLATSGPAGVQISACLSRAVGLWLYALIPLTSEHLINLEQCSEVAITEDLWRLTGTARVKASHEPFTEIEARWHRVVEIFPRRFEFLVDGAVQVAETIDIEESDLLDGE